MKTPPRLFWSGLSALTLLVSTASNSNAAVTLPQASASYPSFDLWRSSRFPSQLELADSSVSGEDADPDRDGITNRLEYAFGLNPRVTDVGSTPTPVTKSNGTSSITFVRMLAASDLLYAVEVQNAQGVWNAGAGYTTSVVSKSNSVAQLVTVTSTSRVTGMRLRVWWQAGQTALQSMKNSGFDPATLMKKSIIPSGPLKGAATLVPMIYNLPNYVVRWYFASLGLKEFAGDPAFKDIIRNYLSVEFARMQSNYTWRDVDCWYPSLQIWQTYRADADDSNCATLILLATRFWAANPTDTLVPSNLAKLKAIAYWNILRQVKANGLVSVFQNGVSGPDNNGKVVDNSIAYTEDNIEVQVGLAGLVDMMIALKDTPSEISYYSSFRDSIQTAINSLLWDPVLEAWKIADTYSSASTGPFYPALQVQLHAELFGFKHQSGAAETIRRANKSWAWVNKNMPNWWRGEAWGANDLYSNLSLANIAFRRGDWSKASSYLQLTQSRWWPTSTSPRGSTTMELGMMLRLLGQ